MNHSIEQSVLALQDRMRDMVKKLYSYSYVPTVIDKPITKSEKVKIIINAMNKNPNPGWNSANAIVEAPDWSSDDDSSDNNNPWDGYWVD